LTVGAGHKPG